MPDPRLDALCIGNAIVDVIADTSDDFLRQEGRYSDAPRPGLVLLDLNLPKVDGREVLSEIKNDERLRSIPVVVLTTSSADEDIVRSYDTHANAFITKPVEISRFMDAIRQIDQFFVKVVRLPPERPTGLS